MSAPCPEFGFGLRVRLAADLSDAARDALRASMLAAVTARGLVASGGGDREWYYAISRDGGQAVDADREAMSAWASRRGEVAEATVGPLVDLTEAT